MLPPPLPLREPVEGSEYPRFRDDEAEDEDFETEVVILDAGGAELKMAVHK